MKMNIPNILTIVRVILVPVFFLCLYWNRYFALAVFIAASLTDFLDGHLARKNNQITNFGKFMDPLADKLLVTTALISLACFGQIPAWVAIIVVGRDLAVDGLRMVAASRNIVMAAGWSGKIKTAVTMVSICVMLVFHDIELVNIICSGLILVLNIVSLVDYFHANGKVLLDAE
ncbi:MAG: CDP-diacylglycerol--glycerol-3-phosphate 3-phosphatidyltransferase [Oscillospiraceae bacterium]